MDVANDTQVGLSLRPMEALFFRKKLITNNKDIENYHFYHPNNIFILGKDDFNQIKNFMNQPYQEIEQEVIDYYDFENWVKRFEE